MSITIKDCLHLPSLSMCNVIAGHDGLNSIVNSISVIEFDDYDDNIYTANELVVSSLYFARNDVLEQCRTIEHCKDSGDVGIIIFYSDQILEGIDKRLIETADRLNFPLILMPPSDMGLVYSDVISDVMEAIFVDRSANDSFVNDTIRRIFQLPESERSLHSLLGFASKHFKCTFVLCDNSKNTLANSCWPIGNTDDISTIIDYLNSEEEYKQRVYKQSFRHNGSPELTLYAVSSFNHLSQKSIRETLELIKLFATISNCNLNLESKEGVITSIVEGNLELADHIAEVSGFDLNALDTAIFVHSIHQETNSELLKMVKAKVIDNFYNSNFLIISDIIDSSVMILLSSHTLLIDVYDFVSEITYIFSNEIRQQISFSYFTNLKDSNDIQNAYKIYIDNISCAEKIYSTANGYSRWKLEFASKCKRLTLPSNQAAYEKVIDIIAPLKENVDSSLLNTLTTYLLDGNSEIKTTSELLFIHRNTMLYRLTNVKRLLGHDIGEMPFSYELYLAVAVNRLLST